MCMCVCARTHECVHVHVHESQRTISGLSLFCFETGSLPSLKLAKQDGLASPRDLQFPLHRHRVSHHHSGVFCLFVVLFLKDVSLLLLIMHAVCVCVCLRVICT